MLNDVSLILFATSAYVFEVDSNLAEVTLLHSFEATAGTIRSQPDLLLKYQRNIKMLKKKRIVSVQLLKFFLIAVGEIVL